MMTERVPNSAKPQGRGRLERLVDLIERHVLVGPRMSEQQTAEGEDRVGECRTLCEVNE